MLSNQKSKFSLPAEVSYLNTAYMSPQLKEVERVGLEAVTKKGLPYEIFPSDFFTPVDALRQQFSNLIEAGDKNRISIIPSVSYGMANAARNVPMKAGEKIILVEDQFPSNVYAWQERAKETGANIEIIASPKHSKQKGTDWSERILDAINDKTAVVSLPHVHWSEGVVFDLKAIREKTSRHGAMMIIDGSQSVGAYPFSIEEFQPDAMISVGYKWMLGPYAIGMGYYNERFDQGSPIEDNWINRKDSDDFSKLVSYQPAYREKAGRYNMGQNSNFILVPMMHKALEQIIDWGADSIQTYCKSISDKAIDEIRSAGFEVAEEGQRSHHLFGIKIPDQVSVELLKESFAKHNIYVSIRGNYIRISAHLFNDEDDFGKLAGCLAEIGLTAKTLRH